MKMIPCPICGKQGELNTFCTECDWFLIDTFEVFSLAPINEDKLQELNSVFLKFQDHRINNYIKRVSQNSQAEQNEIKNSINKLEKQNTAILKEINTIKEALLDLLSNGNVPCATPVNKKEEKKEKEVKEVKEVKHKDEKKPIRQEKIDFEKYQNDYDKLLSVLNSDLYENSNQEDDDQEDEDDFIAGSSCFFGSYQLDLRGIKNAIEWIVLEKENNKVLVISKYALDCKPYHTKDKNITWGKCTLRNWLNEDFINSAFTAAEQDRILTVNVSADENPNYHTDAGNNTCDKIFLLSIAEMKKYFNSNIKKQCGATVYAKSKGVTTLGSGGNCWWWLRSPGKSQRTASCVYSFGDIDVIGRNVDSDHLAVRPALWIDLND